MSIQKREDPRVIQTRKKFTNAILTMLENGESPSKITVQKISDHAGLNRATFYLHYHDINDLLDKTTTDFINNMSINLDPVMKTGILDDRRQLTLFLDYIYNNRKILTVFLRSNKFEEKLFELFKKIIETRRHSKNEPLPKNYVAIEFLTASLVGIITWWVKDGIHFSSEYVADQITLLYKK